MFRAIKVTLLERRTFKVGGQGHRGPPHSEDFDQRIVLKGCDRWPCCVGTLWKVSTTGGSSISQKRREDLPGLLTLAIIREVVRRLR